MGFSTNETLVGFGDYSRAGIEKVNCLFSLFKVVSAIWIKKKLDTHMHHLQPKSFEKLKEFWVIVQNDFKDSIYLDFPSVYVGTSISKQYKN